jgi:hypothetical protein
MLLRDKLLVSCVLSFSVLAGCDEFKAPLTQPASRGSVSTEKTPTSADTAVTSIAKTRLDRRQEAEEKQAESPSLGKKMALAAELIVKRDFDPAQELLDALEQKSHVLSNTDQKALAELKERLEEQRQLFDDQLRAVQLATAKQAAKDGKLEAAAAAIEALLAAAPTTEQGAAAHELEVKIEHARTVRTRMRGGMVHLASKEPGSVRKAAEMLGADQENAVPLLLENLHSNDVVLVSNTLELLRKFNQPDRALPAMVAILGREQQSALWPVTIKELQKVHSPGAGKPLLELALAATVPERAIPALTALSTVSDPPSETLVQLLPKIYQDSTELPAALAAAFHAVTVNHQNDAVAGRGIDLALTAAQENQLAGLSDRLREIISSGAKNSEMADAAWNAHRLAIAMRMRAAEKLPDVKVLRASVDLVGSPAAAVLDGVWNSVDVKTMWQHPSKRLTMIVLDLGAERTVSGIRIWNCNEANSSHRGWKDVEIYVSNEASPTIPTVTGVIPTAPGAAGTADYGTILPVPFARGRYVKLQLLTVWRDEGVAGLSELEVLGY